MFLIRGVFVLSPGSALCIQLCCGYWQDPRVDGNRHFNIVSAWSSERDPVVLLSRGLPITVFSVAVTAGQDPGWTERKKLIKYSCRLSVPNPHYTLHLIYLFVT